MRLHYYNPECDLAMALDKPNYTAPVAITRMQMQNALLPALYASAGDLILLPAGLTIETSRKLKYSDIADAKGLERVEFDRLEQLDFNLIEFSPWGWSRALRHKLLKYGVPETALASQQQLDNLRELCHRRITIDANRHASFDFMREWMPNLPMEFNNEADTMAWVDSHEDVFMKAPWSSSGHGVFHLSKKETPAEYFQGRRRLANEWLRGTLARQGSVMGEEGISKILDCATEWWIEDDGKPTFKGWSVFEADSNGHYLGNIRLPQPHLKQLIEDALSQTGLPTNLLDKIVVAQGEMLAGLIAPRYKGPLGIDMIIGKNKIIAPCVEINLRMTQGMVLILSH